jgi:hypothetical protein
MSKTGIYGAYHLSLRRWRVVEVELKNGQTTRHVYGHEVLHDVGRASSPIKSFDRETMSVTTQSGSHYRLHGLPGTSSVADKAWLHWCKSNHVVQECDVTHEYLDVSTVSTVGFEKLIRLATKKAGEQNS